MRRHSSSGNGSSILRSKRDGRSPSALSRNSTTELCDPTATMSRAHAEIARLTRRLGRLLGEIDVEPDQFDERELRSVLYGLDAVLRLHFAQEDEGYLSLADDPPVRARVP